MTKMKLAPIEPTVKMQGKVAFDEDQWRDTHQSEVYKAMTAECETVEVVDVDDVFSDICIESSSEIYTAGFVRGLNELLDRFTQNGYQIIRKVEK